MRHLARQRRRGNFDGQERNLNKLRQVILDSEETKPKPASYWAEVAGFRDGQWIKPELRQLAKEGVIVADDEASPKCRHWRKSTASTSTKKEDENGHSQLRSAR
jgi:hexokinase